MTTEKERRLQTLTSKGYEASDKILSLAKSNVSSTGLTTLSGLTSTSLLQESDLLVISRSTDQDGNYDSSYSIRISDTTLSSSLESGTLPLNTLTDVNIESPAGHQVIAYDGSQWTNYSWDYLMKDKLQIIEGIGPPSETCDGAEWKEVSKIYVCQTEGKIIFYFQS